MIRAGLSLAVIVIVAALTPGTAQSGWRSNEWVSPSGNIHCEWINHGIGVTCMVASSRRQAVVGNTGRARQVYNWPDPYVTHAYVLQYGQQWATRNGRYFCRSYTDQMVCGNRWTGHGFSISRERIRLW